mmetsp:Transcript_2379/g.15962  ORF Transcript_2379/g.15962 Transcript_2379/m.15962 type:complete len:226 (+) Transcript_2379:2263-2940(+)
MLFVHSFSQIHASPRPIPPNTRAEPCRRRHGRHARGDSRRRRHHQAQGGPNRDRALHRHTCERAEVRLLARSWREVSLPHRRWTSHSRLGRRCDADECRRTCDVDVHARLWLWCTWISTGDSIQLDAGVRRRTVRCGMKDGAAVAGRSIASRRRRCVVVEETCCSLHLCSMGISWQGMRRTVLLDLCVHFFGRHGHRASRTAPPSRHAAFHHARIHAILRSFTRF